MPTLEAGSIRRSPRLPGPTFTIATGLAPASIRRKPNLPGPRLSLASDSAGISAVLYDRADLATPVNTLDQSFARSWQHLLCEHGAGQARIQNDDTALDDFQDDGRDLVALFYRGVLAFLLWANRKRQTFIAKEAKDLCAIYSGPDTLGLFGKATIGPTGGGGRSPIEEDRHFGWVSETFDHSGWDYVTVLGDVQHAIDVIAFELSTDPEEIADRLRSNLPALDFALVGPPGTTMSLDAPVGDWYTWEDTSVNVSLNIAEDGDYFIYFVCDDELDAYVDGQQVATVAGLNVFGVTSAPITLSAGPHTVAAHVRNLTFTDGPNPTKFGWCIATEPTAASLVDPGGNSTVIAATSGYARCRAYPATVPGQSITKTIRLAKEEAEDRVGILADIDLDFTDSTYSDGRPVSPIPDIGTKVGTKLDQFLLELAGTYIDMRVAVVDGRLALQVYEKGTMGDTVAVTFDETNLASYEASSELHNTTKVWVRWDGGWTYLDTGDGDEDVIEIGAPVAIEEVQRMALAALEEVNAPKTEITAVVKATTVATAPYTALQVGDTVTGPTGTERVVGIAMSEDDADGKVLPVLTLRDLILKPEERQARDLSKL